MLFFPYETSFYLNLSKPIFRLFYSDGKKGLTVIYRGIPENEVRDGDIYLTLLRSVLMLSSDGRTCPAIPVPDAQELRKYEFR